MGAVYRATDTKLNRDVAIKVLPAALANDADYVARFLREAQVLATLNHPNIAAIFGREDHAIVMELVEGPMLSERIAAGPLPINEALVIARQIADALEAAHEKGIVHRDLKPGNVKITPDGLVKVLDFGLAKTSEVTSSDNPASSPTLTIRATQAGFIMGTAAYMSPEQAAGKPVDKRADIWSFGVVLWEMLTGRQLFGGETISHTLAHVLTAPIDFNSVPAPTPPPIRELLRRCLDRDVKMRLRDIGEARVAIQRYLANPAGVGAIEPAARLSPRRNLFAWASGALTIALVATGALLWRATQHPEHSLIRLRMNLGPDAEAGTATTVVLSPDGTRIVFPVRTNGAPRLATRTLDRAEAAPMSGTENSHSPFFSPDGQWLAFFGNGKLKKVAVQGGAPITICDVAGARGGSWGEDGNIIFTPDIASGLMRVSAEGGTPQPLTKLGANEVSHRWPQVVGGGKAVLFTASTNPFSWDDAYIDAVSLKTGAIKTVQRGGYFGRYIQLSPRGGYLLYVHEGTLFAVPFDVDRLETSGTAVPLLEDVAGNFVDAGGQFDFSLTGAFVYVSGRAAGGSSFPIVWMDSSGNTTPLVAKPGAYGAPRFSPDGKRLAFTSRSSRGTDIWVYDLERGIPTQLTFTAPGNLEMAWTPDGKHIAFGSSTEGMAALWWMRSDGSGAPQKLLERKNTGIGLRPQSFTPDARRLAFDENTKTTVGVEIWTLPLDLSDPEHPKSGKPEPFLAGPEREVDAAFSPDGKWLAYSSNESHTDEIFVRPFPGPGGKWQISTAGGKYPMWSRNGKELFYLSMADDRIMVANYTVQGDAFNADRPRVWSERPVLRPHFIRVLDLHPDGKRFAVFPRSETEEAKGGLNVTLLLNFEDELRRRFRSK